MVSDESYGLVISINKWRVGNHRKIDQGSTHYVITRDATKEEQIDGWPKKITLHRWIFGLKGKENSKVFIDHKNGWIDNTLESLRKTDNKNNVRYQKRQNKKLSGLPKGVTKVKNSNRNPYESRIQVNSKLLKLGRFPTSDLAHKAYCEAAVMYFGEYAKFE